MAVKVRIILVHSKNAIIINCKGNSSASIQRVVEKVSLFSCAYITLDVAGIVMDLSQREDSQGAQWEFSVAAMAAMAWRSPHVSDKNLFVVRVDFP